MRRGKGMKRARGKEEKRGGKREGKEGVKEGRGTYIRKRRDNTNSASDNVSKIALLELLGVVCCVYITKIQVGRNLLCIKISRLLS